MTIAATESGSSRHVLLAEDDALLAKALARSLRAAGFEVRHADSGAVLLDLLETHRADCVVLDLGLPDVDGLEVLARIRRDRDVPVMVLTGRTGETDRVVGLDMGADDYVTKPAYPSEIAARIRALMRRPRESQPDAEDGVMFGRLVIDAVAGEVRVDEAALPLPPRELDLLAYLARRAGRVCGREELLREVWRSSSAFQDPATVTEHVGRLRRRLADEGLAKHLVTVRGRGYRFDP